MLLCLLFSPLLVPMIIERTSKWILPTSQWHLENSPLKPSQNTSSNAMIRPIHPSVSQCHPKVFALDPPKVPICSWTITSHALRGPMAGPHPQFLHKESSLPRLPSQPLFRPGQEQDCSEAGRRDTMDLTFYRLC